MDGTRETVAASIVVTDSDRRLVVDGAGSPGPSSAGIIGSTGDMLGNSLRVQSDGRDW